MEQDDTNIQNWQLWFLSYTYFTILMCKVFFYDYPSICLGLSWNRSRHHVGNLYSHRFWTRHPINCIRASPPNTLCQWHPPNNETIPISIIRSNKGFFLLFFMINDGCALIAVLSTGLGSLKCMKNLCKNYSFFKLTMGYRDSRTLFCSFFIIPCPS